MLPLKNFDQHLLSILIVADAHVLKVGTSIIWDAKNLLMAVYNAGTLEQVAPYGKKGE